MYQVAEILVEDDIRGAEFCCDLPVCKGACCTLEGGRGAPLLEEEVGELLSALPAVRPMLPSRSLAVIDRHGAVDGAPGDRATMCVEEQECVFALLEQGIARCALERAWLAGATAWRKPLSCHLFPIRLRRTPSPHLRYEQIAECAPGRARGRAEGVHLAGFLREPLTRAFGDVWYRAFAAEAPPPAAHDHGVSRP